MSSIEFISFAILVFLFCSSSFTFSSHKKQNGFERHMTEMQHQEPLHKRRVRYNGKYPKAFTEKYKELAGNETVINKVLQKGTTPAGSHIPIMLDECIEFLGLKEPEHVKQHFIAVDCTLGYGGHSLSMLKALLPMGGRLLAIDQDSTELLQTEKRLSDHMGGESLHPNSLKIAHRNFRTIEDYLLENEVHGKVDGLLADLGFSSMQIDNPKRGFTFKSDGPLDMRMDTSSNLTGLKVLQQSSKTELAKIIYLNSDEPFADDISAVIYSKTTLPCTTGQLADAVREAYQRKHKIMKLPLPTKDDTNKAIARVMQAIRIEVNQEFEALDTLLAVLPQH